MVDIGTFIHSDSFGELEVIEKLGEGGQGVVYRARVGEAEYALKWYLPEWATQAQYDVLKELVRRGSPDPRNDRFVWPLDLVGGPVGGFGYLMRLIDRDRFASLNQFMALLRPRPRLAAMCEASYQLAASFKMLHLKGLCYRDISEGNVLLDPQTGDILICDNDNVGIDREAKVSIGGTFEYMAPEVVRGEADPSMATDMHSLAVLLFMLWMWHHPMHGDLEYAIRCWDLHAKKALYGKKPLFIFDPMDRSNNPSAAEYETVRVRWSVCPPKLKQVFVQAFTDGLGSQKARVVDGIWADLFLELKDGVSRCHKCRAEIIVDTSGESTICWHCGEAAPVPPRLVIKESGITRRVPLHIGAKLMGYHVNLGDPEGSHREVIGEVAQNPTNPNIWGLRNLAAQPWSARMVDGSLKQVPTGRSIPMNSGIEVTIQGANAKFEV